MIETATIYALSALFLSMVYIVTIFGITMFALYVITWGILQVLKPIFYLMNYGD